MREGFVQKGCPVFFALAVFEKGGKNAKFWQELQSKNL